jgi:tetratricopeptide (TPR) repeat protein
MAAPLLAARRGSDGFCELGHKSDLGLFAIIEKRDKLNRYRLYRVGRGVIGMIHKSNGSFCFAILLATLLVGTFAKPALANDRKDAQDCNPASDPDRRISACMRILETGNLKNRVIAYNNLGSAWLQKGDCDRAIAYHDEAIRLDPKSYYAYHNRGMAWVEKGEYDRAIADYDQAIRLNPTESVHWNNRANAWAKKGDYDHAIADYTEAIRLNPKYSVAYALRGEKWRLKGDLDRALADQDRAITLDPKATLAYLERGDTLRYKGEFASAIRDYERAAHMEVPDWPPALTGLGFTYERMGDLATARSKFKQSSTSQYPDRFTDFVRSAMEAARAQLAALDSGVALPSIPISLSKATSATSIPTPAITAQRSLPLSSQRPWLSKATASRW